MRFACIVLCVLCVYERAEAQQAVDPAYLRQFYSQKGNKPAAIPIQEDAQDQQAAQQYVPHPQQAQRQAAHAAYQATRHSVPAPQAPQQRIYVPQENQQQQAYHQPQQQQQVYRPQPQQQQQVYRPQPQKSSLTSEEEEDDIYDNNPSYQFGFDVKDDEYTNYQNRKETRDNGIIEGSYSVVDSDGFIRTVKYTAHPKDGFKAEVIRTPTDIVIKMPDQIKREHEQQAESRRPSPAYKYQEAPQQQNAGARYRLPNIPENVRAQYQQ